MTPYQKEQSESLDIVRSYLPGLLEGERENFRDLVSDYLSFPERAGNFPAEHFSGVCSETCFQSRMSACCSRDGMITFLADVAVNALVSAEADLARLDAALRRPHPEKDPFSCRSPRP